MPEKDKLKKVKMVEMKLQKGMTDEQIEKWAAEVHRKLMDSYEKDRSNTEKETS